MRSFKFYDVLGSGDCVAYYSADPEFKKAFAYDDRIQFALARVDVSGGSIVLNLIPIKDASQLTASPQLSDVTQRVYINNTPKKWAELGLSGNYPGASARSLNPSEKIYTLTEDEINEHVIIHNI
jgi:hypothetical protein